MIKRTICFSHPAYLSLRNGQLVVKLENEGDIIEGQQITLSATVLNANKEFSFRWQRTPVERNEDEEEIWTDISNVLTYTFDATEEADDYFYRATVTAEDGTVLCSDRISFDVLPAEENIVNEPETEETGDVDSAEDDGEHLLPGAWGQGADLPSGGSTLCPQHREDHAAGRKNQCRDRSAGGS